MNESIFEALLDKCIACGSSSINLWAKKSGPDGNLFSIYRCSSCGSGFLNPRPASSYLKEIYQFSGHGLKRPLSTIEVLELEREYPNSTVDARRIISKSTKLIEKRLTNRALDVGSGFGFYSTAALNAGFEVTAINPGKWENDVFEQLNGFRPIENYIEGLDFSEKFDLIIMSQVLEHINSIEDILLKIRFWLSRNGIVAIAVPNIDSIVVKLLGVKENGCLWVPEHLNYFSKKGLFRLLERLDYHILDYQSISRIPYNFLDKRVRLKRILRKVCNRIIRISQELPLILVDVLGYGFYHNVWVKKNG